METIILTLAFIASHGLTFLYGYIVRYRSVDEQADRDLAEMAWGIMANVSGGDWDTQSREWVDAVRKWEADWMALRRLRK